MDNDPGLENQKHECEHSTFLHPSMHTCLFTTCVHSCEHPSSVRTLFVLLEGRTYMQWFTFGTAVGRDRSMNWRSHECMQYYLFPGTITIREINDFERKLELKTLQEGLKHKVASVDITPHMVHGNIMCVICMYECIVCTNVLMHVCIDVYECMYVCHIHTNMFTRTLNTHTCTHKRTQKHIHTQIHKHTRTRTHQRTHTNIHLQTSTHAHTDTRIRTNIRTHTVHTAGTDLYTTLK